MNIQTAKYFLFTSIGNLVYRRSKLSLDSDYPKTIRDVFGRWEGGIWQTIPDQIDTVLTWPNQQIFFFKVNIDSSNPLTFFRSLVIQG